jgi:hypothetical protein
MTGILFCFNTTFLPMPFSFYSLHDVQYMHTIFLNVEHPLSQTHLVLAIQYHATAYLFLIIMKRALKARKLHLCLSLAFFLLAQVVNFAVLCLWMCCLNRAKFFVLSLHSPPTATSKLRHSRDTVHESHEFIRMRDNRRPVEAQSYWPVFR